MQLQLRFCRILQRKHRKKEMVESLQSPVSHCAAKSSLRCYEICPVQVAAAMRLFESMFSWIRDEDDVIMTIDDVLQRAQDAVYRYAFPFVVWGTVHSLTILESLFFGVFAGMEFGG